MSEDPEKKKITMTAGMFEARLLATHLAGKRAGVQAAHGRLLTLAGNFFLADKDEAAVGCRNAAKELLALVGEAESEEDRHKIRVLKPLEEVEGSPR